MSLYKGHRFTKKNKDMKTIETTLYKFEELSEQARQTAIENERNNKTDFTIECETLKEDSEEHLREKGFINPVVRFSLNSCQGDGFSFKADGRNGIYEELLKLMPHKPKTAQLICDNTTVNYSGNTTRYCFARPCQVFLELDYYSQQGTDNIDEILEKLQAVLRDEYMTECSELERKGYETLEYYSSDECIKQELENEEADFLEDGTKY